MAGLGQGRRQWRTGQAQGWQAAACQPCARPVRHWPRPRTKPATRLGGEDISLRGPGHGSKAG